MDCEPGEEKKVAFPGGPTICEFPGPTALDAVRALPGGIYAPIIKLSNPLGTTYYSGSLSTRELTDAFIHAGTRPAGGFWGEAAPYILLAQQLALSAVLPGVAVAAGNVALNVYESRRNDMAINIGGILSATGQAFGGIANPYSQALSVGANIASAFFQPPPPAPIPAPVMMMPQVYSAPAVSASPVFDVANRNLPAPTGGGSRGMTQEIFGAASKMLQRLGIAPRSVSGFLSNTRKALSSLASLARRTPSGTLISLLVGLGLAAQEANQLAGWWATTGKRRRRINPANVTALRRSLRRVGAFEKLAARVHRGEGKICRGRTRSRKSCVACRSNPCRCKR